jgi:hypothetical protein
MLASGRQVQEVARELGINPRTVTRWSQRKGFADLARKHREALLPETPTLEAVLTEALSATKPGGEPDWASRIAAAKAILGTPVSSPEAQAGARRLERVYIAPGEDEGIARPDARTDPFREVAADPPQGGGEGSRGGEASDD